jgi:hypothetical protein
MLIASKGGAAARPCVDAVDVQLDLIRMQRRQPSENDGRNTDLLLDLAHHGLLDRLARLDVSADDVPAIGIGSMRRAPAKQQRFVPEENGTDMGYDGRGYP